MKIAFYLYWSLYILLMFISDINMNLQMSYFVLSLQWLTLIFIGAYPMYNIYVYQETVDNKYLLGCMVSFIMRGIVILFAIYGLDNRNYILMVSGIVIILFYLIGAGEKRKNIYG